MEKRIVEIVEYLTHPTTCTHPALTVLTAGAAGRACVHTGGAGVVAQVTLAAGLVLPLGAVRHAAALVQSPASRTATPPKTVFSCTESTHIHN